MEADDGGEEVIRRQRWEDTTDGAHSGWVRHAPGCTAGFILQRSRNKQGGVDLGGL